MGARHMGHVGRFVNHRRAHARQSVWPHSSRTSVDASKQTGHVGSEAAILVSTWVQPSSTCCCCISKVVFMPLAFPKTATM